ncbi:MAG: D-inositol-3-phosphate glycosyltransferase [Nitrospirae bacterium]|mgnify:CR=1 FL=1|nr:MAG: putative mannosyltransferase [Nitrospira sp. OLB3]MBV6470257.1 D-inositol-3-phosphate glycosyltransferase [Nitrospirota bacterium]MCE7964289.1 glycosyltransferase family 1 protein [Nitrospira sp. NTP2]MCK6492634.1 glycosyltransferase family 4 protein [Nitrospira sp.]MEB2337295.1 glycosyltransferase family 1 protein [Nitrospirales bacterium]
MRIGIDAASVVGDKGGVGWHTHHLLRALLEVEEETDYVGYVRPGSLRDGEVPGWPPHGRLRWLEVPKWAMAWRGAWDRLDLFHGPNFKMSTRGRFGGIVTIHDLWLVRYPEYSRKLLGQAGSSRRAKATAARARKVVTVSEFSAKEIEALYGVPRDRIVVIHNGVSEEFRPLRDEPGMAVLRARWALPAAGFILFVGGADPRKNHRVFLEAVARVQSHLQGRAVVLVGDAEHPQGSYRATAQELGLESVVRCPGRLDRDDLRRLYSFTDLFVFPSRYEGFGMPVLEAMACGAPTITSSTSALPEVAGDAACLVHHDDAEALGQTIVKVLGDRELQAHLRQRGFERARQFTWERAAQQTSALYHDLCA